MKEIKQYVCKFCHTAYADKKRCMECEKNHKPVKGIANLTYKPIKTIPDGKPIKIEVEFQDGTKVVYRR